jgi:hypothetical protein
MSYSDLPERRRGLISITVDRAMARAPEEAAIAGKTCREPPIRGPMSNRRIPARALVTLLVLASALFGDQADQATSTWGKCSRPPVEPCFTHRGRLSGQNGRAHTMWLVGTKRIVAVDNEMPEMLLKYLDMASPEHGDIYGDYVICPLDPDRPGHMRSVCVSSGNRLVVQDREDRHPPVRLIATWPTETR